MFLKNTSHPRRPLTPPLPMVLMVWPAFQNKRNEFDSQKMAAALTVLHLPFYFYWSLAFLYTEFYWSNFVPMNISIGVWPFNFFFSDFFFTFENVFVFFDTFVEECLGMFS